MRRWTSVLTSSYSFGLRPSNGPREFLFTTVRNRLGKPYPNLKSLHRIRKTTQL